MNVGIKNKIFFVVIFIISIGLGLVGWYGLKNTSEAYTRSAYELSSQGTNTINVAVKEKLLHVKKDVLYSSEFYALKKFMIWRSMGVDTKAGKWKQVFSDVLIDFLQTQEDYYQARVIGLDGNEIIKAIYDEKTDKAYLVKDRDLQNKAGRDYVEIPKKLKKGEFYISDLNLNIEHGKIIKPYLPVLRYATPMIDDNGVMVGVFVANFYAHHILDIIKKSSKLHAARGVTYYFVDKDGNYLYHNDPKKMWGAQLDNGENFNEDYFNIKEFFKNSNEGAFEYNNKIYSFSKVHPIESIEDNYWYIISSVDNSVALAKLEEFRYIFFSILIIVLLVSFFVINKYLELITSPLTKVTSQLKALGRGEIKKEDIVYDAKDEIGELVKSTNKVISSIEMTIRQANAVANGNFSNDIVLLGNNDRLGIAIENMTNRLKDIAKISTALSRGDYDVNVIPKSTEDELGIALKNMLEYLKHITFVTESISIGDLDIKYQTQGDKDRLGVAVLQMIDYLKTVLKQANAISKNDFSHTIEIKSRKDELGSALVSMTNILREADKKNKEELFFNNGISEFSDAVTGINDLRELSKIAVSIMCRYISAATAVAYIYDNDSEKLNMIASYAFIKRDTLSNTYRLGEGIVGQVALEREPIHLSNIKDETAIVQSGTIESRPKEIYTFPLIHEDKLHGVVEIMSFEGFSEEYIHYITKVSEILATSVFVSIQNTKIQELLVKSQKAYEDLQSQSEELQESNIQMEEQQQQLTLQAKEMHIKNEALQRAKEEIDKRAEDLEKASRYKSEFLANMSHELRTPLNSIILLSKLMSKNKNINKAEQEKAEVINKAGNNLLLLINDILDLSKIESGNMELDKKEIATSEILQDIKGLFEPVANEKKLKFISKDNLNTVIYADDTKLLQVIKNLLSNAFKFTKDGEVVFEINKVGDNKVELMVKDSGIGIPEDKLETIFEAFKQVDGSISREYGGTGLGLSISKTIIDLMGGTIDIESEIGKGSSFKVIIPLEERVVKSASVEEYKMVSTVKDIKDEVDKISVDIIDDNEDFDFAEDELSGKNILIVDDDSRNIFTLTSLLENLDADVHNAFNGQEAIDILKEEDSIDIILMDIMMPIMDGLEAIRTIKSIPEFKDIPIIAITAKTMPKDKEECLEAGANDYLPKPLSNNALISTIKAWID
jgi:signal transduction histidine kinase/CheY-like chemotaxis protein/HAMP domain-containing protein